METNKALKRCRVCGIQQENQKGVPLFGPKAPRILRTAIKTLFAFQVKSTDASKIVCGECAKIIKEYYSYYIRVRNAQKRFHKEICGDEDDSFVINEDDVNEDNVLSNDDFDITDGNDGSENTDLNNYDIKKEEDLDISENLELNNKNDLSIVLNQSENEIKSDIDDLKCFKTTLNDDYSVTINFNYQSEDNKIYNSDEYQHQNQEGDNNENSLSDNKKIDDTNDTKKHKLKKKLKTKQKYQLDEDGCEDDEETMPTEPLDDLCEFPTEIIKDGKLIIKGPLLDDLISKFYNLKCDKCSGYPKFKDLTRLMKHYDRKHGIKGYLTCCNAKFYQHRSIYMHMARHLQPSAFECPICKKVVSRPHSLKLHLQTHLPEAEKPHKCDQCDRRFIYIEALTSHKMTHVPVEERKTYDCKICGKTFTLSASFSTHMRAVHSGVKYLCSECGRSFQRKNELTFHMLTHDTTGKNQVQCQYCGFICKNQPTLRIHLKRHSLERLQCNLCGYNTHRRQQLNVHMRVKHSDEKPYVCVVCGKQFKLKSVMMTHMAQHTGERKYKCAFCPRAFASPGNYHSHRKREHAEEHRNDVITRRNERFKKIDTIEEQITEEDESHVHELARQYLQKIADKNSNKKNMLKKCDMDLS